MFVKYINNEIDEKIFEDKEILTLKGYGNKKRSSSVVLNKISEFIPQLFGGSADLESFKQIGYEKL